MAAKFFIIVLICLSMMGISCKKGTNSTTTYRAKVVYKDCGYFIFDVEGNNSIGTRWSANRQDNYYNNAVDVRDYCYLVDKNVKVGNTVEFTITQQQTAVGSNCPFPECFAYLGTGKSIYINDVVIVNP